ncbi:monooxygenase [Robbsia andropogonis]|uniref:Monooxygenase n=2 Tax=Robbsia andropogonis TaxID=28092 RepID=A0A0F5JXK4_9BURK|nr:FAD-dependent monooxygenase [Robbsia andropogonis]KKB62374.1 monooxygenase [Robbsia andropogonis]MCP1119912.1 FAD-dependent monooxygenase [Robbsia andropogonis]MCP1129782.1 FAD-dependent monooxygenase [Robbsia andropogonis]
MDTNKPLDIIIAGAGIAGLSAALALRRAGHLVRVFERTRALQPIGAAISVWPNGVKVLRALGLGVGMDVAAGTMNTMSYRDQGGHLMTRFALRPLYESVHERAKPIARTALQRLLLEAVDPAHVVLGAACVGYSQDADGVTVTLDDGEMHRADVFVVADGNRSGLRDQVAGVPVPRRYRGYVNWNGRIPVSRDLAEPDAWEQFVGEGKRVSLMPMGTGGHPGGRGGAIGEFYFFFDVPMTEAEADMPAETDPEQHRRALEMHFAGWAPQVKRLIERLDPETIARVAIYDTDPVPRMNDGRVVMIGDAAHAMAPDLGQGGCLAMEDAWLLARALDAGRHDDLPEALQIFAQARLPRVRQVIERARARAALLHGSDATATQAWYDELRTESGEGIIAGLHKTAVSGPFG